MFDVKKIREDFPVLQQKVHGKPLVYFDNGATTQKPIQVARAVQEYYTTRNSSIHRGVHFLSSQATDDYEQARETVREFLHANSSDEIIFTSGTTGSLNLLAFSFGEKYIREHDEILVTEMEHHANIVPWQMMCARKNAVLKVIPFNDDGTLQTEAIDALITDKTKLLSLTHASNVLGTINPVKEIIKLAHKRGVPVCIDAAQSVQHIPIDVKDLDCDFLVFSGHKIYGPTGIGVLYGKEEYLKKMPPYQGGGDMVDKVSFETTSFNQIPFKFEAGTTNYIGAVGLAEAIKYIQHTGLDAIAQYEHELLEYATQRFNHLGGIKLFGTAKNKSSILSFLIEGVHPLDAGMIFDKMGIAVRTGTHCAQPIMQHYQVEGMIRASLAFYNTKEEIDYLCKGIEQVKMMFKE